MRKIINELRNVVLTKTREILFQIARTIILKHAGNFGVKAATNGAKSWCLFPGRSDGSDD